MSKYIINWMKIKNFKVFDEFEINFNDSCLVSFGGPNGYGKTTIFDAIELGMTGTIDRIKSIDPSGSQDNIVSKDQNQLVEIEIKLINTEGSIFHIKRILKQLSTTKRDNKTTNFKNLWKLIHIDNEREREISQTIFESLLQEPNLNKYYNHFFYVQQEDTAHFLINNERVRLEKISELFNLNREENELENVSNTKEKIVKIRIGLETRLSELESQIVPIETVNIAEYNRLLPWKENVDEWDNNNLQFTGLNTRENYLKEVKRIKKLSLNKEDFFKYYDYKKFLSNSEIFEALLINNFFEQYDEISDKYDEKTKLLKIIDDLDDEDLLFENEINFEPVRGKIDFNLEAFELLVNDTSLLKGNLDSSEEVISEIMDLRNDLIESFNASSLDKEDCPLCGYDWKENPNYGEYKLLNALDEKKEYLESLIEGETQQYRIEKESLANEVEKFKQLIEDYIESNDFSISESMYEKINEYKEEQKELNSLLSYLNSNAIDINDLLVTSLSIELDDNYVKPKIEILLERLNQKVTFERSFLDLLEAQGFLNVYSNYFDDNPIKLNYITIDSINNKIKFIEYSYYNFNQLLQSQIDDINEKIIKLNNLITDKIAPLETIYKREIKKHKEKTIKDIELPFYIYSGKVLQSIRNNRTGGIFIKDPVQSEGLQNIRFVSDYSSDHDVVNTVSSGQLAGIVIALTLTLNKVYSNGFKSIMIDDPVQSMDDINMISLIELFRNEFSDNQIFVSTHEDEIEKYILYKFMKYKLPVTRVDVMNKEFRYKEGNV
ncbi:AAA family ATPase [Malaciobacter canalis]|uniref:ATP-binding protein n=1 Tax=Malaciobacter canalis TaxID=1912871 RepID=UPI00384FFC9D